MFTTIEGFKTTWTHHAKETRRMLDALTDKSLKVSVADDHRDIGRIAWHIIQSIPEMGGYTGLKISGPEQKDPVPGKAKEIAGAYTTAADSLLKEVTANWEDKTLMKEDDLYGQTWKKGLTLRILMDHEIHHRGQITVLMRKAGLKVPGVFGPSKEEWDKLGMKPPEI